MKLLLTAINAKYIHSSLSMRYLKKYCEKLPYDIAVSEFTINNHLLDIADQIFDQKPDILGIECYIWNIELIKKLLLVIHKMLPDTKIICGGPEISYNVHEIMEDFQMIDYVIRGEGEQVLYSLLNSLSGSGSIDKIPGLAYRNASGEIIEGFPVVFSDLDCLPFPYSDKDMASLDNRIIYYESSRGCPFSCKYCLSCATKGVRYRSLDKVIPELAFFVKHNVRQVKFVDRTFNANKKHFIPILSYLATQKCRTNFHFEITIDYIDDEALSILKQMPPGRVQLEIGIQSTNAKTLEQVSRINDWQKISSNICTILSFKNIHVHTDLIIGLPYEDMDSLHRSFNEVYALYPDMLQVGFLKLLKGSAMKGLVDTHKYSFMDSAPYQILSNAYLSTDNIRFLRTFVDVFDLYYNSGRFKNCLKYCIKHNNDDAFSFFCAFASFWHEKGLDRTPHSPKLLYKYIADFIEIFLPDSHEVIFDLLKFDALCADNGRFRAEFLNWCEKTQHKSIENFWKNAAAVKNYVPDYAFTNWRSIKTKYHIEYFSIDVLSFEQSGEISNKDCIVLFIYNENSIDKIPMNPGDFYK